MDHDTKTTYETKTTTNYQPTGHQFNHHPTTRRLPKGERRVRFADSMGMELVSIFLIDLISNYYFASFHHRKSLQAAPTIIKHNNNYQQQQQQHQQQQLQQQQQQKQQQSVTTKDLISDYYLASYQSTNKPKSPQAAPTATNTTTRQPSQTDTNNRNDNFNYNCEFTQPISLISFKERVRINKVHLETCQVNSSADRVTVSCTIRVLNLSFEKSVLVRYTTDGWHTHTDAVATYKPGSCDGWSDKFIATFVCLTNQTQKASTFKMGQRIIFAIKYENGGGPNANVYWDNNGGLNYSIKNVCSVSQ